MIAGHAPLAFGLVALVASRYVDRRRALVLGAAAGGFALVPDVDMAYAVVELLAARPDGVWSATGAFWEGSKQVHRAITHSLVLAVPAAAGFALSTGGRRRRIGAAALLSGLVATGLATGGALGAAMMGLYAAAGVVVAAAASRAGLPARAVLLTALAGLLTHPFGDVFTGTPPRFLYPVGGPLLAERVTLHGDPTLALLAVFFLELGAIWFAAAVGSRLLGRRLRRDVDPRAAVGGGYGAAALLMPAPTLDVSYHFVFSVLAVGGVGAAPLRRPVDRRMVRRAAVTGLAAVTAAGVAYAAVYLVA